MIPETTSVAEQQVNDHQSTPPVTTSATTVATRPHPAVQATSSNIQYPQQPVQQPPSTGQSTVSNPTQETTAQAMAAAFMIKLEDGIKKLKPGQRAIYKNEYMAVTPQIIEYERTDPNGLPRKEIDTALKASMGKAGIPTQANTPGRLMIAKRMCGENSDRAKKIAHCGLVAYKLGFLPTEKSVEQFYKEYGPPQTVWTTLDKNGKRKTTATSNAADPGNSSVPKHSRKDLISRGKLELTNMTLYKAAPQSLKNIIDAPLKTKPFVIIAEIDPNLGFQMKAVIEDNKLLNDAYMTYGKGITNDEDMANRLEKLAEKNALSIYDIRKEATDELADECERLWKGAKDTTDFYKDVPEGLKEYNDLLQHGYVEHTHKMGNPLEFYEKAVMKLKVLKEMGIDMGKHLDCEFDPNIHVDIMHMPQLLATNLSAQQDQHNKIKQQAFFADILKEKARRLRAKFRPT